MKKISEKISIEGTLTWKNLPWGTKGKNLKKNFEKKNIFIKSFGIYGLYNRIFLENFEKKFEIKISDFFLYYLPPYLKKPPLGDQRKKSEIFFEKKYFQFFFQIFLSLYFFSIPSGTFSKKILKNFWRKFWENQ